MSDLCLHELTEQLKTFYNLNTVFKQCAFGGCTVKSSQSGTDVC